MCVKEFCKSPLEKFMQFLFVCLSVSMYGIMICIIKLGHKNVALW